MRGAGIAFLVLSAAALQAQGQLPTTGRVTLQGRVMVRGSASPVPNARIVAARVGGGVEDYKTATSNSTGWFVIQNLPPGSYRVHADASGYLRSEHGRPPVAPSGTPVVLTEGINVPDVIVLMTPTGVIAGRVTDKGRPASNVWVRALKPTYRDGQRFLSVEEYAVTDDRGEYRLFDLPPGSYYVSAIPAGGPRLEGDALVTPTIPSNANGNRSESRTPATLDNVTSSAFEAGVSPAVYYPNTTDPAAATVVEVGPGANVLAIDLALTRTATFRVRGRIETQGLTAAPKVRVSIFPIESGTAPSIPSIEVPAGEFDLPGVPPGRYHLSAQALPAPGERSAPLVITRVRVEVWDRDVEGVVALLQPGVTVSGRVTVDGVPAGQPPAIQLLGLNGLPGTSATRVAADGTFTINNVTVGDYRWRVIPLGGSLTIAPFVKSATFGTDDASKRVISIGLDAASRKLEVDISTRTAVLAAMVLDGKRNPMAGVLVIAVPDPTRRMHSDTWRSGVTDAKGQVTFEGLAPGDYQLFATETIPAESWQNPAVLKRFDGKAAPVKLEEGTRKLVVLAVTS